MAVAHKGSISMGMVLIPIGLYKTTVDNDIHFNQLEKESKARIKKLVNKKIDINNSNGDFYREKKTKSKKTKIKKSVYRFATMAAACVLVLGGVLFMNTDSVKASLAKLFGFVPGIGVVEVILILVVLIGLVIIFKKELNTLINDIFEKITNQAGKI